MSQVNRNAALVPSVLYGPGILRLGRYADGGEALYDLTTATNHNIAAVGQSGSGKTFTIQQIVGAYHELGITTVILDVHGDYDEIPGVPAERIRTIRFSYDGGDATINPLHVQAGANGGVMMAVRQFLHVAKLFFPSLGSRQLSTLRRLVDGLYAEFGYDHNNPETWQREPPTVADLLEYATRIQVMHQAGTTPDVFKEMTKVWDEIGRLPPDVSDDERAERARVLGEKVHDMLSVVEQDELAHWDPKRLDAVHDALTGMARSGFLGADSLSGIRPRYINRLLLRDLHVSDQTATIYLILDRLFNMAYRNYPGDSPKLPRMMIVLDEGKIAKTISTHELSPLNRIATEARKFGLGVVLGVQSTDHMTDDVRRNCGLIALLPVHQTEFGTTARQFGVSADDLRRLTPRSDGLLFLRNEAAKLTHLFAP